MVDTDTDTAEYRPMPDTSIGLTLVLDSEWVTPLLYTVSPSTFTDNLIM